MIDGGRFHHIGVACRDLEREEAAYTALGYRRESGEFDDPGHGIRGVFLEGVGPRLELVMDRPGSSVLEPWLRRRSTVYHFGYEVDDLGRAIAESVTVNAKLLVPPRPAVAFDGRSVAFVILRNAMLLELIARH